MCSFFSGKDSTPFIIRIFKKFIREWTGSARDVIYAYPVTDAFDYVIIQPIKLATFSAGWKITAVYEVVNTDQMNKETADLFRLFKGMECELVSEGLLRRRFYFRSFEPLNALRNYLPEITISNELVNMLNENEKIMSLIRSVKPDALTVTLDSLPLEFKPFSDLGEAILQGMISFFKNPAHITWLISVGRLFTRGLDTQKVADGVFYLLEEIAINLKNKMKNYLAEAQLE